MKKLEIYRVGGNGLGWAEISARDGMVLIHTLAGEAALTKEEAEEAIWALHEAIDRLPRSSDRVRPMTPYPGLPIT